MTSNKMVVVGVDGSPDGTAALRWAEVYALETGADIMLVTVWHWPTSYGVPIGVDGWDPEGDAQKVLEKAKAQLTLPDERVHALVECGSAGEVLVRMGDGSGLLVVGTRGHGALTGSLVGSISSYCIHHAQCPVVVVR